MELNNMKLYKRMKKKWRWKSWIVSLVDGYC